MNRDIILIVDDKEVNRYMLYEMFKNSFKIIEASDGIEAIEKLKENVDGIVMVLLDIIMPNMDGFGVLEYMKEKKLLEEIPVVMITSDSSIETEKKLEEYDVAEVVRKPFIPAIVDRRVSNIISLYENKRRSQEKDKNLIIELKNQINEMENKYKLDIDESVYLVKVLYNKMFKAGILDEEIKLDVEDYFARYLK